jgi:hypothetical protein
MRSWCSRRRCDLRVIWGERSYANDLEEGKGWAGWYDSDRITRAVLLVAARPIGARIGDFDARHSRETS